MPRLSISFCRYSLLLVCILGLGCQPEPKVETYTVERTSPARPPLNAAEVLKQLDHILVAIVPQGDKAWFFKLVGKAPAIERQRKAFREFLANVKLADTSADTPSWQLPEGWKESTETKAMRSATLIVPDSEGDLEMAVSSLPLDGDWEDFLVPNVNRWLRQLERASLSKATVLKLAQKMPYREGEATVFELAGMMSQRPMGGNTFIGKGPHEGLGIAAPSTRPAAPPALPLKTPPAASKELTYKTPEGWLPGKMSMMRKAAFLLPGGGPSDGVTVTSFPAAPGTQMADVALNVQRWAGQVGMAPPAGETLEELTELTTVAGIEATYVELTSPAEAATQQAIYVAMVEREGQVWFFKMHGKPELVSSQRDAFREFLGSVAFP